MRDFQDFESVVCTPADLGRLVRARRRAIGLRIDAAAALCGVSVDLMSRLENGHSGVSSERLLKVFGGLGLTLLVLDKARAASLLAGARPSASPRDQPDGPDPKGT